MLERSRERCGLGCCYGDNCKEQGTCGYHEPRHPKRRDSHWPGLHDKDLKWRGSIVLNLLQVRFCDNLSECRREYKLVGSKSYVEQDVDHSLHHIAKRVLGSDDKGRLPINICQLLGNSDIVQRIPEGATSEDLHKMWLSSVDSAFDELRKRYNISPPCQQRQSYPVDRIHVATKD